METRRNRRYFILAAFAAAAAMATSACSGGASDATPTKAPPAQPTAAATVANQPTATARPASPAPTSTSPAQPSPTQPRPAATSTPAQTAGDTASSQDVVIVANNEHWSIDALKLKVGQQVNFSITNNDEEPHNLLGPTAGLVPGPSAPDVLPKKKATFSWTVADKPGMHTFMCIYHPEMTIKVTIEK